MTNNSIKSQAFKLKGRLYTFTVLQVLQVEPDIFSRQLEDVIAQAPKLFENSPVVLDLSLVADQDINLQGICQMMKARGMIPVAVQGGNPFIDTLAQCQGLAVLNASSTMDKPIDLPEQEVSSERIVQGASKLLTTPVRSGQQVVAKASDLIVTASVSRGAELLADGNIHVYGALRGRALAGISGDRQARIFCQSLDAELVSIAGFYRLSDAIEKCSGPCQIYLQDEHIRIEPI